jgi:hypothetical protein
MKEQLKSTVGMNTLGGAVAAVLVIVLEKIGVKLATVEVAILVPAISTIMTFILPHNLYQRIKDRGLNGKR